MGVAKLSITFFLQMAIILATCRIVGWLGQKYLKQPQVVCAMIAGVLLGRSLFGLVAHDQGAVAPAHRPPAEDESVGRELGASGKFGGRLAGGRQRPVCGGNLPGRGDSRRDDPRSIHQSIRERGLERSGAAVGRARAVRRLDLQHARTGHCSRRDNRAEQARDSERDGGDVVGERPEEIPLDQVTHCVRDAIASGDASTADEKTASGTAPHLVARIIPVFGFDTDDDFVSWPDRPPRWFDVQVSADGRFAPLSVGEAGKPLVVAIQDCSGPSGCRNLDAR